MLKQLYVDYVLKSLNDRDFYKFQAKFIDINLSRVYSLSLISALATILFGIIPNLVLLFVQDGFESASFKTFLLLQFSLVAFMLLFYLAAHPKNQKKRAKNEILLVKPFVLVILLHASGLSAATFSPSNGVSVFLLSSCALMLGLYWPGKRLIRYLGIGQLLYLLMLYLIYRDLAVWHTHFMTHLLFTSIFFFLSRFVLDLKIRDFLSLEKIEQQAAELSRKNQKLSKTEDTLNSINRSIHQGIFRLEKNQGITYANDYLSDMLGYISVAELMADTTSRFISPEQLAEIESKVNEQGYADEIEVELRKKNGQAFWAQINCSVRYDKAKENLIYEGSAIDISFKKKALQEALENATKLEQAEKIAHTGFYEIDITDGHFSYSAGLWAILETSSEDTLRLAQHLSFIHTDDQKLVRETLLEAISSNKPFRLDYRIITPNQTLKYLTCKGSLLRDEKGHKKKLLVTVQDISSIRQSEYALAQSEAYIKAAFNNNRYGIYILDTELCFLGFNEESKRRVKTWHKLDLQKGMSVYDTMLPETRPKMEPLLQKALTGQTSLVEYKLMEGSPYETWAELYISPVKDAQEKVIGLIMMGSDISNRKKNEELFENLSLVASHTDNAVMISDSKYRIEWVNEAFTTTTGYSLNELLRQYPKDFLVTEKTNPLTVEGLTECLRTGSTFKDEILICNKEGKHRWMHMTVNPVYDQEGRIIKYISIYTDLDKIKAYENQLQQAKENAERSAESKDNFLSSVSHELRTPLNAVIGLTHHLLQNEPREDQLEDLNILKFSAENLLSLINDILDLSKIEAGKVRIDHTVFNLHDIISSLKQTFKAQVEAKGLEFKVYLNDTVPQALVGDPVRLIQILTNLLSNAVKFTSEGSVYLYIAAEIQENNLCQLQIRVEDTGIGIPEDKLSVIFDKFEQASQATTRTFGGTGLGLAITRQLIELQGGQIGVKSTLGKGSCFSFTIPYRLSPQTETEPHAMNQVDRQAKLDHLNLLLVEDNKINQTVAGKFLKNWKINYTIAENGADAVQKAREQFYDLILMDLQMPVMDGYEASRQIRSLQEYSYQQVPIIAITAAGNNGIDYKIQEAGMTDIILKPFKPQDLLDKISYYCPYKEEVAESSKSVTEVIIQRDNTAPALLNLSEIHKLAAGDNSFVNNLFKLYIEQFAIIHQETVAGLKGEDTLELRRIFHKMKPSVLMLGQDKMLLLSEQIHRLLHDETPDFKLINPLTFDYLNEMEKVKNLLQAELDNKKIIVD